MRRIANILRVHELKEEGERKPSLVQECECKPRVWPTRVTLGVWLAFCSCMLVADASWTAPALLASSITVAVGSGVLGMLSGARLKASIELPDRAAKGDELACALSLSNGSSLPVMRAQVPVDVKNPLTGESFNLAIEAALPPRGKARVPFAIQSPHCGSIVTACNGAWALDLLGVVRRRRELNASAQVAVPPAALPLGTERSGARAYDIESFTYSPSRPGDDPGETFAVREYVAGDSVRRIHWKLSGKVGSTMVRESGFPIFSTLAILVETAWDEGTLNPSWADAQMEVAAALMSSLLEESVAFEVVFVNQSSGVVVKRNVSSRAALWEAIGMLLAAPRVEGAPESVRPALESREDEIWAHVVYLTAGAMGAEAAMLSQGGGSVTVLRCSDEPSTLAMMDGYCEVRFAPGSWQSDLAGVEL